MESKRLELSSPSKKVLFFDMDGTLTPARKSIQNNVYNALQSLMEKGHLVCIVSGSPFHYIEEQLNLSKLDYTGVVIMPCNGTQVYIQNDRNSSYDKIYEVTMKDFLRSNSSLLDPHRDMVTNILELQLYAARKYEFPMTGNFISDRGSMLNWSMIGRDASHEVREKFVVEDKSKNIRKHLRECLRVRLDAADLHSTDLALGGSTSIDIFPNGWDKTHALRHIAPGHESWFWGDKCMPGGNDHALWKKLNDHGRAFQVNSPEETVQSLQNLIQAGDL